MYCCSVVNTKLSCHQESVYLWSYKLIRERWINSVNTLRFIPVYLKPCTGSLALSLGLVERSPPVSQKSGYRALMPFVSHWLFFTCVELRENLTKLGANLRQSLIESARKTWESINEFARAHSNQGPDEQDVAVEEATEVKGKHGSHGPGKLLEKLLGP